MKTLNRLIAVSLVYALGVQPTFAQFQAARTTPIAVQTVPVQSAAALVGGLQTGRTLVLPSSTLQNVQTALPTLTAAPALSRPGTVASVRVAVPGASAVTAAAPVQAVAAPAKSAASYLEKTVAPLAAETAKAVEGVEEMGSDAAGSAAAKQFSLITREQVGSQASVADPVPAAASSLGGRFRSLLSRGRGAEETPAGAVETPAPKAEKGSFGQVFKDPERNKSFWRYVAGYTTFLVGFEMYVVGIPFLISDFTKNILRENHDLRVENAEALKALIRQTRSMRGIAHWVGQGLGYLFTPLFSDDAAGPRRWLVRSYMIRAVLLGAIPVLFFASGVFSVQTALLTMFALVGLHAFVQGISVTTEGAATTRLIGDKSVTAGERMKANSILTFVYSTIAILGPAIAGQLAQIGNLFGKSGAGGAVIYAVYAGAVATAGFIYATIRIFGGKAKDAEKAAAEGKPEAPAGSLSVKGVLKSVLASIVDGTKMVFKNRFLATLTVLGLVSSLFADPLIFNILPEFVENVLSKSPAIGFLMNVPGLGWFLKSLMSTPMGYYSLLVVFSSVGAIVATALAEPLRKLFVKLGFKTEESLTIPFYTMAVLEAPLFWLMISTASPWAVLGLYGLQAFFTSFAGIIVSGLQQKTLGSLESKNVPKVLAAQSFLGIIASIIATYLYGFVLSGITMQTSLMIAAVATTVLAAVRLAAPWLFFSKAQRQGGSTTENAGAEAKP